MRCYLLFSIAFALAVHCCSLTLNAHPGDDEATIIRGFAEPNLNIQVAFSQPGKLRKVNVQEGARVEEGDLLASLDEMGLPVDLAIAKLRAEDPSREAGAAAEVDALDRRLAELNRLLANGGATQQELDRVNTDREIAVATLQQIRAERQALKLEVQRLEDRLERLNLYAPCDGFITEVHRQPGEFVLATEPKVVELVQLSPLKVKFFVPVELAQRMLEGTDVEIALPQLRQSVSGTIELISPLVDPESGTLKVTVAIPNADFKLRAGIKCEWRIQLDNAESNR